ncbi:MAG: hypothetical protein WAU01_02650 [Saprospiraceae bacterium]
MFHKIKSLFIVEDGTPQPSEEKTINTDKQTSDGTPSKIANERPVRSNPISDGNGTPDAKFTDLLLKAIESNNMEGFDYLEFKNSLMSLTNVIPDEGMRYKSAFEMAKTMGLTKDKLIQSAGYYINILANEDKKFKEALENQKTKQIAARANQLSEMEKSILQKQQAIEKLNAEIESSKAELDKIKSEIDDAVVKIDVTNQQFVASYHLVHGQIYDDLEKIKSNI